MSAEINPKSEATLNVIRLLVAENTWNTQTDRQIGRGTDKQTNPGMPRITYFMVAKSLLCVRRQKILSLTRVSTLIVRRQH